MEWSGAVVKRCLVLGPVVDSNMLAIWCATQVSGRQAGTNAALLWCVVLSPRLAQAWC